MRTFVIIISLLLPLCLPAQQVKYISYHDDEETRVKEKFYVSDPGKKLLVYEAYYEDGGLRTIGYYREKHPDSTWLYYDTDGALVKKASFSEDNREGYWYYYDAEGKITMEGRILNGKREDHWIYYYNNGEIQREGDYLQGERTGVWREYTDDGKLQKELTYEDGAVRYTEFYPNGNRKISGVNRENKPDGLWSYYFENEKLQSRGNYRKGKKEGIWEYFYPNGQLSAHGNYLDDFPDGEWIYYFENGQVRSTGELKEGKKHGNWKRYFENGNLKGDGSYFNGTGEYKEYYDSGLLRLYGTIVEGKRHGKWTFLNEQGNVDGEAIYNQGKGRYTGYFPNGKVKVRGQLEGEKKIGKWELYNRKGDLEGYYKPYTSENLIAEEDNSASGSEQRTSVPRKRKMADYAYKRRRESPFKSRGYEYKAIIPEINPVSMLFKSLPVGVEYYIEERLGHTLVFGLVRDPFFSAVPDVEGDLVKRGFYLGLRQKFYFPEGILGMTYLAHELRFHKIDHQATLTTGDSPAVTQTYRQTEIRYEYSLLVGKRIMQDYRGNGFTLDGFAGVGIGYRTYNQQEDILLPPEIFEDLPDSRVPVTFRLGLNIGYAIGVRR